jgi:hypothetical protein
MKTPIEVEDVRAFWLWPLSICLVALQVVSAFLHLLALPQLTDLRLSGTLGRLAISPELGDKAFWVSGLALSGLFVLIALVPRARHLISKQPPGTLLAFLSFAVLIQSIAWTETNALTNSLWSGFGFPVLLASAVVAAPLYFVLTRQPAQIIKLIGILSVVVALVFYLPSILQPIWAVVDPYSSMFIYNEILAPSQGNFMLSDAIPQYTTILGLPFLAVWKVLPILQGSSFVGLSVSVYTTFLATITILGFIYLAYRTLPRKLKPLAVLFTVPLILVKVNESEQGLGSITALLSAIPVRLFPLAATGILLLSLLKFSRIRVFLTGLVAGLAALNNFEFGIPTLIAASFCLVLIAIRHSRFWLNMAVFVSGAFLPFLLYGLFLFANGNPVKFEYWVAFVLSFGSGFGSIAMAISGPQILVLSLFISASCLGSFMLFQNSGSKTFHENRVRASILLVFFGVAGIGSFGYFIGRSVLSGQLQIFLAYIAMIIVAIVSLEILPILSRTSSYREVLGLMLTLAPIALAVACVLQAPDVQQEWRRLALSNKSGPALSIMEAQTRDTLALVNFAQSKLGLTTIDYAGSGGNLIEALGGPENISPLDVPSEAWQLAPMTRKALCARLESSTRAILTQGFFDSRGTPICEGFSNLLTLDDDYVVIRRAEQ